jgi:hypothetical protein
VTLSVLSVSAAVVILVLARMSGPDSWWAQDAFPSQDEEDANRGVDCDTGGAPHG